MSKQIEKVEGLNIQELPMEAEHKSALRQHWQQLSSDFKLL
ncbi:hypothetical protein [Vibrio hepatarius]|nr:hypothetical protein [Vibrio hepatarius]